MIDRWVSENFKDNRMSALQNHEGEVHNVITVIAAMSQIVECGSRANLMYTGVDTQQSVGSDDDEEEVSK